MPHPDSFHALVATPDAVLQQQERFAMQRFGLVVFDEVHHVVKNHPYRKVAEALQVRFPWRRSKGGFFLPPLLLSPVRLLAHDSLC